MLVEVLMAVSSPAFDSPAYHGLSAVLLRVPHGLVVARASLGIPDTLFIFVVALVVFGPKRLPEIGKQLGKLMFEFRRASNDFKLQIEEELRLSEQQEKQKVLEMQATAAINAAPAAIPAEAVPAVAMTADIPAPDGGLPENGSTTGLSIQPPSSGFPVEAQRPNRSSLSAIIAGPSSQGAGGSSPELREAIARGTAATDDATQEEAAHEEGSASPSESATAHHG